MGRRVAETDPWGAPAATAMTRRRSSGPAKGGGPVSAGGRLLPTVQENDDGQSVVFQGSSRGTPLRAAVECVIDLTDFGDLLGLEIISISQYLREASVAERSWLYATEFLRYDDAADSLYVHVAHRENVRVGQRVVPGAVVIDSQGALVRVELYLRPE